MRKKDGLNVIYDIHGRRRELKGKSDLRSLPYKEYYLTKNHLIHMMGSSRETVNDVIKQLNLGYRFFNSSFGDLLKWYLFDRNLMREFIARVKDKHTIEKESAGKLVNGQGGKSAEFHFERWDCDDLFYLISYPAGTNPEKVVSGFINWREYSSSIGTLYRGKKSFSVKGLGGEVRGQRIRNSGEYGDRIEITFVDSEAFYDRDYPHDEKTREKYEYSSRVSLEFLLNSLK